MYPRRTFAITHERKPGERPSQAQYLRELLGSQCVSARDLARQSKSIAEDEGNPKLAFGHSSVCYWLEGSRNPSFEHRRTLAEILGTTLDDINQGCDGVERQVDGARLEWLTVYVSRRDRQFKYSLILKKGLDLGKPAIHRQWADMFRSGAAMARHFRDVKYELYGWIPDCSAGQHRVRSLVPLRSDTLVLDSVASTRDRIWFMYLPGGRLECGIAFKEKRSLALLKHGSANGIQRFPLSRVDLVGYVVGETLFRIVPSPISISDGRPRQGRGKPSMIKNL